MGSEVRDFSFEPVQNPAPGHLTSADIALYNREGFVRPFDIFTPDEVVANRVYFDGLFAKLGREGAYSINCYQARARGIWDLCTDARILDHVEDLIGPNIICWASHFFAKMPFDNNVVPWHQDATFWQLSPTRTVTVWLAIDDADEENSAMEFIPRTHNLGHLEIRTREGPTVLDTETVGAEDMGEPCYDSLRAGQISLHADMLVHGSKANKSDRRRCGLTIRYCPPEVEIIDASWAEGVEAIACRGVDPTGLWKQHSRPDGENVSDKSSPLNVGGN